MSIKPLVVDWKILKKMGWPFCRAETDRGEKDGRYPKSFKLGSHRNSRRMWRVADILAYFESCGLKVTDDWYAP
jgi:predicted DNA-binding transcriptional regulator AlpA